MHVSASVRSIELYLRSGGRFGFVMPRAALTRQQFAGFRGGRYLPSVSVSFELATRATASRKPVVAIEHPVAAWQSV